MEELRIIKLRRGFNTNYCLYNRDRKIGGIFVARQYPYYINYGDEEFALLFDTFKFKVFELSCFGVIKGERGKGYGRFLFSSVINDFGCYPLQLRVGACGEMDQKNLIAFYESFGFIHGKDISFACPMIRLAK